MLLLDGFVASASASRRPVTSQPHARQQLDALERLLFARLTTARPPPSFERCRTSASVQTSPIPRPTPSSPIRKPPRAVRRVRLLCCLLRCPPPRLCLRRRRLLLLLLVLRLQSQRRTKWPPPPLLRPPSPPCPCLRSSWPIRRSEARAMAPVRRPPTPTPRPSLRTLLRRLCRASRQLRPAARYPRPSRPALE